MPEKNYIIAIDSGAQSVRAVLFDRRGNEIALEQADYDPSCPRRPCQHRSARR